MATHPSDVLEELNLQIKVDREVMEKVMPSNSIEAKLYEFLEGGEMHLDKIVRELGLQVSEISGRLTVMELKGLIKNIGNGVYSKT